MTLMIINTTTVTNSLAVINCKQLMGWRVRIHHRNEITQARRTQSRHKLSRRRPSRRRPCLRCTTSVRSQCDFLTVQFSSSAKLQYYERRTISGKVHAIGFAATMRLLSNYSDLLLTSDACIPLEVHVSFSEGTYIGAVLTNESRI